LQGNRAVASQDVAVVDDSIDDIEGVRRALANHFDHIGRRGLEKGRRERQHARGDAGTDDYQGGATLDEGTEVAAFDKLSGDDTAGARQQPHDACKVDFHN
jgi:hypothetical protein